MNRIEEAQEALGKKLEHIRELEQRLAHAQKDARAISSLLANLLQKQRGEKPKSQEEMLK